MRAMILAAGQGKRLRPITNTIPKPLVEAAGKSLILWHLEKLKALGITQIIVNGAWLAEVLFTFLNEHPQDGMKLVYSPETGDGLETAGGIIKALPFFEGEPFLVVNGDVFIDSGYDFVLPCPKELTELDENGNPKSFAHLYLTSNPAHNLKGDYALTNDGALQYGQDYTFAGVAWYHPVAFAGRKVAREPLRPYFDQWVQERKITAEVLRAPWFDVGTIERLEQLREHLRHSDGYGHSV